MAVRCSHVASNGLRFKSRTARITLPLPFSLPTASTAPAAPSDPAIRLVSIGSIGLRDIVVTSRGRELMISADSSLAGSRLLIRTFSARTAVASNSGVGEGGTALSAEGEVDLAPRVDARLKVKANRLDLDELISLAAAFAPPPDATSRAVRAEPARIAARVSAETASAAGMSVRQFATDLEIVGTRVSLSPLTFQLFGGRYQGSLAASLRDTMTATLRSRVIDLDVAQLAEFGGSPGSITGRLTGTGTFTGSGSDFAAVVNSARGEGTSSIANGSIRHLNLVRTVILFFGRPAPGVGPVQRSLRTIRCCVHAVQPRVLGTSALAAFGGR